MVINNIEEILNIKQKVVIKIYNLDYTIEILDSKYIIYPNLYPNSKSTYNSLNELLNKYEIYNKSIFDNLDRVCIIESEE